MESFLCIKPLILTNKEASLPSTRFHYWDAQQIKTKAFYRFWCHYPLITYLMSRYNVYIYIVLCVSIVFEEWRNLKTLIQNIADAWHLLYRTYRVRQSFRESHYLQDCERTIASIEKNDTSVESPWSQL